MERTIKEYEWKEKIEKGKWIEKETYNENAFQIRLFISPSLWFEFQEHFWKMKFFAICLMKSNKSIHVHENIYFLFRLNLWKNNVQFIVHRVQSGHIWRKQWTGTTRNLSCYLREYVVPMLLKGRRTSIYRPKEKQGKNIKEEKRTTSQGSKAR